MMLFCKANCDAISILCVIELLIFKLVFLPAMQLLVLPEVLCNITI